ncbi:MAG TPA: carbohydrate binding domain-containing protein [Rariglobus sp.]|nr:carbohydrate binding domain-containing protein [Rariglobus sp.]
MKISLSLRVWLCALCLAMNGSAVRAARLVYEPFDYGTTGASLAGLTANTGTGLSGAYTIVGSYSPYRATANLPFTGTLTGGGRLETGNAGTWYKTAAGVALDPTLAPVSGELYMSWIFRADGTLTTAIQPVSVGFNETVTGATTTNLFSVYAADATGLTSVAYGTSTSTGGQALVSGTTYLLIARFTRVGAALSSTEPGTATLWVLTSAQFDYLKTHGGLSTGALNAAIIGTAGNAVTSRVSVQKTSGTVALTAANALQVRVGSTGANIYSRVDEICLGTTIGDVIRQEPLFTFTPPWNDSSVNASGLAFLSPTPAGTDGYVFVDGNGHLATTQGRIRFWGANTAFDANFPSATDAPGVAGRLAKFGFNVVRFHHMDNQVTPGGLWNALPDRTLDAAQLTKLDKFVYELKQRGVYANFNLNVSRPLAYATGDGLDPSFNTISAKGRSMVAFFDTNVRNLQKSYASQLLNHVNTYTGTRYAVEPAVAFVEVSNEIGLINSFKRGGIDSLPLYYRTLLNGQWTQWLKTKYGSDAALRAGWGVVSTATGTERLLNGTFAGGTVSPWILEGTSYASVTAPTNEGPTSGPAAKIAITSVPTYAYSIQLSQPVGAVATGTAYTATFQVKSAEVRRITVNCGKNGGDWSLVGLSEKVDLAAGVWTTVSFTFVPSVSSANTRIIISNLGERTGTVWLANASFKPGGAAGLLPGENLDAVPPIMGNFKLLGEWRTPLADRDWYAFLHATEKAYWVDMRDYIKNTLGSRSLLIGTAVGFSTPNLMSVFDVVDSHAYYAHPEFPGDGWSATDWYVFNQTMLNASSQALSLPGQLAGRAVLGKPFSVTEFNIPLPNTYGADTAMVMAAYAGLQDWDAVYYFDYSSYDDWSTTTLSSNFDIDRSPVRMASCVPAALAFRQGHFAPGTQRIVVPFSETDEIIQLPGAASDLTDITNAPVPENPKAAFVHALRLAVESAIVPPGSLSPGTTPVTGTVLSADNGQLSWNSTVAGRTVLTGNSPRTRLLAGFVGSQPYNLGGVVIAPSSGLQNGYSVITLGARNGTGIADATSLLLTLVGCETNTSATWYQYPNTVVSFPPRAGINVTLKGNWGTGPVKVEGIGATVILPRPASQVRVWPLTASGARQANEIAVFATDAADAGLGVATGLAKFTVSSAFSTLWYEIEVN